MPVYYPPRFCVNRKIQFVFVAAVLSTPGIAGGAFRLGIDRDTLGNRLTALSVNVRSSVLRMPYGDQGLFVRKTTFEKIGGFPLIPIMEDFEFVRALRRLGGVLIVPAPVVTSSRRWDRVGTLRSAVVNQLIVAGHMMCLSPERLLSLYRGC